MPRTNPPQTPLLALLRACTPDERIFLAGETGTSVSYLYHLATCKRTPSVALAQKLVAATEALRVKTEKRTARLTISQLACMCNVTE